MSTISPSVERELGNATGNLNTHGYPFDLAEPSAELQWPQSVFIFDQMRRQDAQVAGVLRAVTLPIRRAAWHVKPNGARDEVVQLVADDLGLPVEGQDRTDIAGRQRDRFSWDEHLRMALMCLPYGHMGFEQVYRIVDGRARLRKLAPRMPRTIAKINVAPDGGLESIEQYGLVGQEPTVSIPVERLVWYALDREAGQWQGLSLLRSAYKHWMLKDRLIRVGAMTVERNGMGIPVAEAPMGATPAQLAELNKLAQAARAGEYSGGAVPFGAKLTFQGVQGTLPDALPQITYHDKQIALNVLAQFLELGHSTHGSRAMASSFIDFFQLALDAIAGEIASTANAHIVEDLVDLNWGPDEPAPRLVCASTHEDTDVPPDLLKDLVDAGVIEADDDLEAAVRERFHLPPRNPAQPAHPHPGGSATSGSTDGGIDVAAARPKRLNTHVRAAKSSRKTTLALGATRRTALYARFETRQRAALRNLGVDPVAIADQLAASHPQVAAAVDPLDPMLLESITAAVARALADAETTKPLLHAVTLDAIREAEAEATAEAMVLLGLEIDFDLAFDEAMASLADLETTLAGADAWVTQQLESLGSDIGRQLAKLIQQGASRDQLAQVIANVLDTPKAAWLFLDNAIAAALTDGALTLYRSEGVTEVDFVTVGDDRVDDDCAGAEASNPYQLDDVPQPPLHLNCRCTVAVTDTGAELEGGG